MKKLFCVALLVLGILGCVYHGPLLEILLKLPDTEKHIVIISLFVFLYMMNDIFIKLELSLFRTFKNKAWLNHFTIWAFMILPSLLVDGDHVYYIAVEYIIVGVAGFWFLTKKESEKVY